MPSTDTTTSNRSAIAPRGWRLTVWITFLALAVPFLSVGLGGWNEGSVLLAARLTARLSLALFALAFGAAGLLKLWPNRLTRWIRGNRRYLGVSFAVAHFVHLGVLITRGVAFPEHFVSEQTTLSLTAGGLAYLFILMMALTSSDRAVRRLGPKWWRRLHLVAGWYIWAIFLQNYLVLASEDLWYLPQVVVLLAVGVLRGVKRLS